MFGIYCINLSSINSTLPLETSFFIALKVFMVPNLLLDGCYIACTFASLFMLSMHYSTSDIHRKNASEVFVEGRIYFTFDIIRCVFLISLCACIRTLEKTYHCHYVPFVVNYCCYYHGIFCHIKILFINLLLCESFAFFSTE